MAKHSWEISWPISCNTNVITTPGTQEKSEVVIVTELNEGLYHFQDENEEIEVSYNDNLPTNAIEVSLSQQADTTLYFERLANQLNNKEFSNVYKELEDVLKNTQESFAEIQAERTPFKYLQEEVKDSHDETPIMNTIEFSSAQQDETLPYFDRLTNQFQEQSVLLDMYKELQELFKRSQERFAAEIQAERLRFKNLHEQLEEIKASYNDRLLMNKHEQANTLQHLDKLKKEMQEKSKLLSMYENLHKKYELSEETYESDLLQEKMKSMQLEDELGEVVISHSEECLMYETKLTKLKQHLVDAFPPETQHKHEISKKSGNSSLCKRLRHFLGLKGP